MKRRRWAPTFTLLIAAAIVFAPGPRADGSSGAPSGSDLVARVLAPTVDKGALLLRARDADHLLGMRELKRRPRLVFLAVDAVQAVHTWLLLWVVSTAAASLIESCGRRIRFSRAPPLLQPA
jgi:hypothetical protein